MRARQGLLNSSRRSRALYSCRGRAGVRSVLSLIYFWLLQPFVMCHEAAQACRVHAGVTTVQTLIYLDCCSPLW